MDEGSGTCCMDDLPRKDMSGPSPDGEGKDQGPGDEGEGDDDEGTGDRDRTPGTGTGKGRFFSKEYTWHMGSVGTTGSFYA